MSETLQKQIQDAIAKAAEKSVNRDFLDLIEADRAVRSFKAGAEFILPLLMKAISQRNAYPESDYPARMCADAIERDNKELLEMVKHE